MRNEIDGLNRITVGWLHKQYFGAFGDPKLPQYCLPLRVLGYFTGE